METQSTNLAYIMLTPSGVTSFDTHKIVVGTPTAEEEWTSWQRYVGDGYGFPLFQHIYNGTDHTVWPWQVIYDRVDPYESAFVYKFAHWIKVKRITVKDFEMAIHHECHRNTREDASLILKKCSMRHMVIEGAVLIGSNFDSADLTGITFRNCTFGRSNFYGAVIRHAVFDHCNLDMVSFRQSDLTGTMFHECSLISAVLNDALIQHANFVTSKGVDPYGASYAEEAFGLRKTDY